MHWDKKVISQIKSNKLSKEGSKLRQFPHHIPYAEAKTLTKNRFHQYWKQRCGISLLRTRPSLWKLERWQQTTIVRLRTGHCQLLSQAVSLKRVPMLTGIQDPEHILKNWPSHTPERTRLWPSVSDFRDKLWGSKEGLRSTAQSIKNIHLQI